MTTVRFSGCEEITIYMRFKLHRTSVSRIALLLSAILLGIVVGMSISSRPAILRSLPNSVSRYKYLIEGLILSIFVLLGLAGLERGIDRQHQLEKDLLDAFLRHIPDSVFFKDLNSRFVRISHAMAEHCSLRDPSDALNKTDADIFTAEHAKQALADEQEIIRTGQPMVNKEEKESWPDGHETWVVTTKVPLKDRTGKIVGTMGISHDNTERKEAEVRTRYLALHDPLTDLPNRILLEDRLSQAIALASRDRQHIAILILDLDRFKNVNDSLGHYMGDRVLNAASKRLKNSLRESDTVARVAGDQFAVVLQQVSSAQDIQGVAQKIQSNLSEPFLIDGNEVRVSVSIGVSQFPKDSAKPETLLRFADAAMYEAKKRGSGQLCFFSPVLSEATHRHQKLESDLVHAFERDEFILYYQPFVESNSGRITGMEALLRWMRPSEGLTAPNQFIPVLEELGLMAEVGRWALRTACRQVMDWRREGLPALRMAVNVSPQQFYEGNIINAVQSILHETGIDPRLLELELTESQVLDDSPATINIMQHLKRMGVSLSLDDFGTGWSSLSYLRRFPLDRLKIDRSFVRDIGNQRSAEAVVKSILNLGRNLGIACIAEGIETVEQRDYFRKQPCAEMQGFLFSRPVPAVEATALLRTAKTQARLRGAEEAVIPDAVPAEFEI
jgi:diguanylate cyclase (GGDEF)-like protein/PAS domain S-box-containing protein